MATLSVRSARSRYQLRTAPRLLVAEHQVTLQAEARVTTQNTARCREVELTSNPLVLLRFDCAKRYAEMPVI